MIVCGSNLDQVKANVDACADERPLPQVGRREYHGYSWLRRVTEVDKHLHL